MKFSNKLNRLGLRIVPVAILFIFFGFTLRSYGQLPDPTFEQLVAGFLNTIEGSSHEDDIKSLLQSAYMINLTDNNGQPDASELRILETAGILFDDSGSPRDPNDTVGFYVAILEFRDALNNSNRNADLNILLMGIFSFDLSNGIDLIDLDHLDDSGLLFDASGNLNDPQLTIDFYEVLLNFFDALDASVNTTAIENIINQAFGIDLTDNLQKEEIGPLANSGILFNATGAPTDPVETIVFYDVLAEFFGVLDASPQVDEIKNVIHDVFGINLGNGLQREEIEPLSLSGLLFDNLGVARDPQETVAFYEAVVNFLSLVQSSEKSEALIDLILGAYGINLSTSLTTSKITTLAASGLIFDDVGTPKNPETTIDLLEAIVVLEETIQGSENSSDIFSLLAETYTIRYADGISVSEINVLATSGVIFDDSGQFKEVSTTVEFFERIVVFERLVFTSDHSDTIHQILFDVFAINLPDGFIVAEITKLTDSGILFDDDGNPRVNPLLPFEQIAEFLSEIDASANAAKFRSALKAMFELDLEVGGVNTFDEYHTLVNRGILFDDTGDPRTNPLEVFDALVPMAEFIESVELSSNTAVIQQILSDIFGLDFSDTISDAEIEVLTTAGILYDDLGQLRSDPILPFELIADFLQEVEESIAAAELKNKLRSVYGVDLDSGGIDSQEEFNALLNQGILFDDDGNARGDPLGFLQNISLVPYTLTLVPGWNLISIPVQAVMMINELPQAPIAGEAWKWENGRTRVTKVLTPRMGYWIFSLGDYSTTVMGTEIRDLTLPLVNDWNLIGPVTPAPFENKEIEINEILNPEDTAFEPIWFWNHSRFEVAKKLKVGQGYWFFAVKQ